MPKTFEGTLDAKNLRIAIVASRFNNFITDRLVEAALDCLQRHGASRKEIAVAYCPGAFELPLVTLSLIRGGEYDAVIALGCVIRGATPHFEYVCAEAARGIADVSRTTGIPVAFGVLTVDTIDQAIERSGSKAGNKGWDAAMTAIEMASLLRTIRGGE